MFVHLRKKFLIYFRNVPIFFLLPYMTNLIYIECCFILFIFLLCILIIIINSTSTFWNLKNLAAFFI